MKPDQFTTLCIIRSSCEFLRYLPADVRQVLFTGSAMVNIDGKCSVFECQPSADSKIQNIHVNLGVSDCVVRLRG